MESEPVAMERATLPQPMPTPFSALAAALPTSSNQRLLGAALAGLLCLAPAACSTKDDGSPGAGAAGGQPAGAGTSAATAGETGAGAANSDSGKGGAAGSDSVSMGGAGDVPGAGGSNAATAGAGDSAGGGNGSAAGAGAGGAAPELPHITSSEAVGVLTEEAFKALCDARGGTVEVMPHCGGFATAKGFSYDNGTQLLSEHTCAAANTCGGWNCVITE